MSETLTATLPLQRWQGERGTYHLVTFTGEVADELTARALLDRLEFGRQRGFGSIKVTARIGETQWSSSVFPQRAGTPSASNEPSGKEWVLLISRKVMRAEELAVGDALEVSLTA
ncbi:MAG: DUF1905 domain-containing protein [Pseudomonadota bacterium]